MFASIKFFIVMLTLSALFCSRSYGDWPVIKCQLHEKAEEGIQSNVSSIDPDDFDASVFLMNCGDQYSVAFEPIKHDEVCAYPMLSGFNQAPSKNSSQKIPEWFYLMTIIKPEDNCPTSDIDRYTIVHKVTPGSFHGIYDFIEKLTSDEKVLERYLRAFKDKNSVIRYYDKLKESVRNKHKFKLVETSYFAPIPFSPSVIRVVIADETTDNSWIVPIDLCMDGSFCIVDSLNNPSRKTIKSSAVSGSE